jgi:thiol-disulfide isomerase/thioredoxin
LLRYCFTNIQKKNTNDASEQDAQRLYKKSATELNPETVKLLSNANYQYIITRNKLEQMIEEKQTFYVYFFSPTCPHCIRSTNLVNNQMEQRNIEIYQYNVLEDQSAFDDYKFDSTPTIAYFKDGVQSDQAVGEVSNEANHAYTPESFGIWLESHK